MDATPAGLKKRLQTSFSNEICLFNKCVSGRLSSPLEEESLTNTTNCAEDAAMRARCIPSSSYHKEYSRWLSTELEQQNDTPKSPIHSSSQVHTHQSHLTIPLLPLHLKTSKHNNGCGWIFYRKQERRKH